MALIILFAVVTVLALGYIAVQLTGRGPGSPAAVKTGAIAAPSAAPARGASA